MKTPGHWQMMVAGSGILLVAVFVFHEFLTGRCSCFPAGTRN